MKTASLYQPNYDDKWRELYVVEVSPTLTAVETTSFRLVNGRAVANVRKVFSSMLQTSFDETMNFLLRIGYLHGSRAAEINK